MLMHGITYNPVGGDAAWQVAAGDTETVDGVPYSLQLSFDGSTAKCLDVTPDNILETFIEELERWAQRGVVNVCYFHNLRFDLQALLWSPKYRHWFAKPQRDFIIPLSPRNERAFESWLKTKADALEDVKLKDVAGHEPLDVADGEKPPPPYKMYSQFIHCFTDKNWFAKLHLPSHRAVWLVDSRAFFPSSLEKAAQLVNSPYQKLDRPIDPRCKGDDHVAHCRCLGKANLSGDPAFEEYRRNDVLAQWHVGNAVANLHHEYDVKTCVSLPHLAARIFKHRFMPSTESIPFPPVAVARAAELSYHGGLNFMTVEPGWYRCHEIDINSAYTWAMTRIPPMGGGEWEAVERVPEPGAWGFLKVSGHTKCRYGILFSHDFKRLHGRFADVWVTTREVEQAVKWNCATITSAKGWVWRPSTTLQPFKDYAEYFWAERKKFAKNTLESVVRKLLCNALYGKTVQTTKFMRQMQVSEEGVDVVDLWRAGGIYNPCVGSWITAEVRAARLHEMAHRAEVTVNGTLFPALHGSTDAIKTMADLKDLPNVGDELGEWKPEVTGPCLLLRPKLYVHEKEGMDVRTCTGKTCPNCGGKGCGKIAYHGFRGDVKQLLEASESYLAGKPFDYFVEHCWTVRQALVRTKKSVVPLNFERVPLVLRPGWKPPAGWVPPTARDAAL